MALLIPLVIVGGLLATMLAWRAIRRGRPVWQTLPPVLGIFGAASLLLGRTIDPPPAGGAEVPVVAGQIAVGLASGALFFAATRVFVALAARVQLFRRHVVAAYEEAGTASDWHEVVLSLALAVPGEELLWRGLAYRWGASQVPSLGVAALLVWVGYIVANVPSRSLAIVAGAIVGGALWGWLAWWSGGVAAPFASHLVWTGAMIAFPPRVAGDERAR